MMTLLWLYACFTHPPCPEGDDRFRPDLEPTQRFEPPSSADGYDINAQPCEGGITYGEERDASNHWCVAGCSSATCQDGYEGLYCVSVEHFEEWSAAHCIDCSYTDAGDYTRCKFNCEAGTGDSGDSSDFR